MASPLSIALLCIMAVVWYNAANYAGASVVYTKYELTQRRLCPGYQTKEIRALSDGHCGIKCYRNTLVSSYKCIGYCFNTSTKRCTLYKKVLEAVSWDPTWVSFRYRALDRNYAGAVTLCEAKDEWLVIPQTQEELDKIGTHMGGDYYYVGLNSLHQHGNFTTAEGKTPVKYFWAPTQPNLVSTEDCVIGYHMSGWYDAPCSGLHRVYCQTPEPVTCFEGELMVEEENATYDAALEPCYKLKYD